MNFGQLLVEQVPEDRSAAEVARRDQLIGHLAFDFVLEMASRGISGLKPLETLLIMAINQANIAPLTRDPEARDRYGALDSPAPDELRRPVSVRAVAASMRLPYETARRNIRRLEQRGVCSVSGAGVVVPAEFLLTPAYLDTAVVGHDRMYGLYRVLRARGLLEPLPPAQYAESKLPVRAAARLMSDFLLRSAEALDARTGDLISSLVILPLLAAAAGADPGRETPRISVAALARRVRLPSETVRRHVANLAAAGLCEVQSRGVNLADRALASPLWRGLLRENAIAVQRLYAGLSERGIVAVWEQLGVDGAQLQGSTPAGGSSSSE
jgi:DNA-binding Lrp family transcriptional regulator